jgi:hypothetical protein
MPLDAGRGCLVNMSIASEPAVLGSELKAQVSVDVSVVVDCELQAGKPSQRYTIRER